MQREIKIRVWLPKLSKMVYLHEPENEWNNVSFPIVLSFDKGKPFILDFEAGQNSDYDDSVIMGYTGFKDKNGKDIYERDILKDGSIEYPYLREVYWDDRFQWSLRLIQHNNQFSGSLSNDKYIVPEEMRQEIIGNIFENENLWRREK